jgi:hypothetical protein
MLRELIEEGKSFRQNPVVNVVERPTWINRDMQPDYLRWQMTALLFLQQEYKNHPMVYHFKKTIDDDQKGCHLVILNSLIGILEAFEKIKPQLDIQFDFDFILSGIFEHFHACALQLRRRHAERNTLLITDEYDVQDLLHAILRLNFSDVRPEEWTPSYAGNSNRMDFLLKEAQIAIEVKMTRNNLKDKEVGEQLIIDIAKYKQHPHVKTLYCFVYDPDSIIYNPTGLEKDLNQQSSDEFHVKVFVRPK